jgi:hypothetical protein
MSPLSVITFSVEVFLVYLFRFASVADVCNEPRRRRILIQSDMRPQPNYCDMRYLASCHNGLPSFLIFLFLSTFLFFSRSI